MNFFKSSILLYLMLSGCNNNKDCDSAKVSYDDISSGVVMKKIVNECESDRIITEQEFMKIKDSLVPDGSYKKYFSNQRLEELAFYKKGRKDSIELRYYENGKIRNRNFRTDYSLKGPQKEFYENGKLKDVTYHIDDSTAWSKIFLSNEGKVVSLQGNLIHLIADVRKDYNNLKVNDVLSYLNEVVILPGMQTYLNIQLSEGQTLLYDSTVNNFTHVICMDVFPFGYRLKQAGNYRYRAIIKILDSKGNTVAADSIVHQFSVL